MIWHRSKEAIPASSRQAWLLVGFMWIAYFMNYSDRQVVYSLFPLLKSELHFTNAQLGLMGSLFQWSYSLCSPIAGQLGDRFSKRRLAVVSLCLWSGVTVLTGLAYSPIQLMTCQSMLALTQPLFAPAAMALMANAHGTKTRSRAISVYATAQLAGVVMGGWYGGFVAQEFHWRLAFFSLGAVGILYAIPCWGFLRNLNEEAQVETKKSEGGLAAIVMAKVPTYLFLNLSLAAFSIVQVLLYMWLPNFLYEKFSLSLADAGFTATVYLQSATVLGLLAGGWLADWLYGRTKAARIWLLSAGLLISTPFLYLLGNSSSLFFTKMASLGCGLGTGLFIGNLMISSFEVVPADTQASAVGILNFTSGIISGFTALLAGVWKDSVGIHNMMSFAALTCLFSGLLLIVSIKVYFQRDYQRVH